MTRDTISQSSRHGLEIHESANDFVSDVIVYCVERGKVNMRKLGHVYAKRYLHGDIWFKILLHIYTDGHLGKYIARVTSAGRRRLDDARDAGDADLMRKQMQGRVLETIVESGENGKRIGLSICPSFVRLEIINQCSFFGRNMLQHGIISSNLIARLGSLDSDRKAMLFRDLFPDRFDERRDKMVQDRAQMVNSFISQDFGDWRIANYLKAVEVVRSIGIYLTAYGIWLTRLEAFDDSVQMAQVLTCPAELEFEPVWWREVYCQHEQETSDTENAKGLRDSGSLFPVP